MDERKDALEWITMYGYGLFGKYSKEVAEAVIDEVEQEVNDAGDDDWQKAFAYVILDKFGKL